jgi:tRNA pseudouridine13 synthase
MCRAWTPDAPAVRGRIRTEPRDFEVDEVLGFEPDGHGTARAAAHREMRRQHRSGSLHGWPRTRAFRATDVGYSGLKDRRAVTPASGSRFPAAMLERWHDFAGEGYRVLGAQPHTRKLRRGSHRAKPFSRDGASAHGPLEDLAPRLTAIGQLGVPNFFGGQRFGRDFGNLERARDWALRASAHATGSSAGSRCGRAQCAVQQGPCRARWPRQLEHTVARRSRVADGRQSFFAAPIIDAALVARCSSLDLHPSGPMHGKGESPAQGLARELETSVLAQEPELMALLGARGTARRAACRRGMVVRHLRWQLNGEVLELHV